MPADTRPKMSEATEICGRLFASAGWQDAWRQATAEVMLAEARLPVRTLDAASVTAPLYYVGDSALWRGYEDDADCRDILPGKVAYLSSLYAITSPVNRADPRVAGALLDLAIARSKQWGADVLLVTNLETPSIIQALIAHKTPAASVRLDATCRAALPARLDAFIEGVGKSARSDLRRRHRRADELGVQFHVRQQHEAVDALPQFLPLTEQAATQHGNAPLYDLDTFTHLLDVPGAMLLTAEVDHRVLAGSLSFLSGDCLVVWAAGVDYEALKTYNSYVFLLYETLQLAIRHGCTWMDFGRGTFEFKRRHGFTSTTLHTLAYNLSTDPNPEWVRRIDAMDTAIQPLIGA